MNESQKPEEPENQPRFRLNVQVFQIFGLVIIALALPFTILILGLLDIRKNTKPAPATEAVENTQSTSEASGLRSALQSIAESQLPMPTLDDGIRRYVFVMKSDQFATELALRSALNQISAICIEPSTDHQGQKFLARLTPDKAKKLEIALLELQPTQKPLSTFDPNSHSAISYEITLRRE